MLPVFFAIMRNKSLISHSILSLVCQLPGGMILPSRESAGVVGIEIAPGPALDLVGPAGFKSEYIGGAVGTGISKGFFIGDPGISLRRL